jgi:epoxyqueuosine reductase QueG
MTILQKMEKAMEGKLKCEHEHELSQELAGELSRRGAAVVGFADLAELPPNVREGLPVGVSVAVKYPDGIIQGIADLPTAEYFAWYNKLNDLLDSLATYGAERLKSKGYAAIAQTRERVGLGETEFFTLLPHKTVATRAGIGWIGKCALLVTEQYGSMVRLSSILTDAPLKTAEPVNESRCGACLACTGACPAGAVSGRLWRPGLAREEFFDAMKCHPVARERSKRGFGGEATICGKCIEVCPHTRKCWTRTDER